MIKPDAIENGHIGAILEKINAAGFNFDQSHEMDQLSQRDAECLLCVYKERPFFGELVEFMTRGPIVAAVLEKEMLLQNFVRLLVLPIQKKLLRALLENYTRVLLERMLFMAPTVMKMPLLKLPFIFRVAKFLTPTDFSYYCCP